MNMVGSHHVVQHRQTKALLRLEDPVQITAPMPFPIQSTFRSS
jgi:hypothetical protein